MINDSVKSFIILKYGDPFIGYHKFYKKVPFVIRDEWAKKCIADIEYLLPDDHCMTDSIYKNHHCGNFFECVEDVIDAYAYFQSEYGYQGPPWQEKYHQYKQWLFNELCKCEVEDDH